MNLGNRMNATALCDLVSEIARAFKTSRVSLISKCTSRSMTTLISKQVAWSLRLVDYKVLTMHSEGKSKDPIAWSKTCF